MPATEIVWFAHGTEGRFDTTPYPYKETALREAARRISLLQAELGIKMEETPFAILEPSHFRGKYAFKRIETFFVRGLSSG